MTRLTSIAWLLCLSSSFATAADWPQWMGPKRDGVWRETGIVDAFPPAGPKVLWRRPIGGGYADPMQAVEAYVAAFQRIGGEVQLRTSARKLLRDGARLIRGITKRIGGQ